MREPTNRRRGARCRGRFAGAASRWRSSVDGVPARADDLGVDHLDASDVPTGAVETAQDAAGIAVLVLLLTAVAAAAGGAIGAKMWPASRRSRSAMTLC
jgi:hypothetical protein